MKTAVWTFVLGNLAASGIWWLCTHPWTWSWASFGIGFGAGAAVAAGTIVVAAFFA